MTGREAGREMQGVGGDVGREMQGVGEDVGREMQGGGVRCREHTSRREGVRATKWVSGFCPMSLPKARKISTVFRT